MKTCRLLLVFIISLVLACPALAQMGPGSGGPPVMGQGMMPRLYNPQTVTTVKGTVEKLEEVPMGHRGRGMVIQNVILKTDKGNLLVHLAPTWYLDEQKFTVKAGDILEVTGSQVTLNNQPAIIAKDVMVSGKTLKLRNDQGVPAWRGRGMGPQGGPPGS